MDSPQLDRSVTKRELVTEVAERLSFTQGEVADITQALLDTIVEFMAKGYRLEIRNFGVFEVKARDARVGRNPRTGQEVPIEGKRVASFKAGKALKQYVQTGSPPSGWGAPAKRARVPRRTGTAVPERETPEE